MRCTLLCCLLLSCLSCGPSKPEKPENVLTEQEMVELLQEIYLTESKISKLSLPFDSSKGLYNLVEDELFRRHDITDSVYEQSMNWYYDHPEELMRVYEKLVDTLMVIEKRHQEKAVGGNNGRPTENER